jgi:hypothetical protein
MNPVPRPPSPSTRVATQRAIQHENTNQLSACDAALMSSEGSGGGSGSDIRERARRHVAQVRAPASPVRGAVSVNGPGRWEQREVELGHGLAWAPTRIRVREWVPGGVSGVGGVAAAVARTGTNGGHDGDAQARALHRELEMEQRVGDREGERRTRERLAEYELGYARSRLRSGREVTGRFREVLGVEAFEVFKKCEYS